MKWPCAFNGLMSTAAFLLPLMAAADSHIESQAPNGTTRATAHLDFKIVIPQVLFLQAAGTGRVAIMSNSRNVSLSASARSTDSGVQPRGHVILSAAAGKVIAQDAECARFVRGAPTSDSSAVICTASMP